MRIDKHPPYDLARAVMRYEDAGRELVLNFKHGDKTHTAPLFGQWLARLIREALDELPADGPVAIAPVPVEPGFEAKGNR